MMVSQVIKTVGYTNFSPFIPIPNPIIAPTAGTLTTINPIVINNFTIIASQLIFLQNEISANHKFIVERTHHLRPKPMMTWQERLFTHTAQK